MADHLESDHNSLLARLEVPAEFSRYGTITEESERDTISRLDAWKDNVAQVLRDLQLLVAEKLPSLTIPEQGDIVAAAAAFDGAGPWISDGARESSAAILSLLPPANVALLSHILEHKVKPLFRSNPHPDLNLSTGRKLSRPAGGPMASQDYYENQTWKNAPGAANLLSWCVRHLESEDYQRLWHLIIPPVMTLLDDYEAPFKLRGVQIVQEMLDRVPKEILRRTGVDGLLRTSLNTCLGHLQNPESASLLRAAIPATLSLIQLTSPLGSAEYFDQLCKLLGDGVIGTVWLYSSENSDVILATLDTLPLIVQALGIGSCRYLKALIQQLVHPLLPNEFKPTPLELQISSLVALTTVIEECAPRIILWKGTILDGVARCWVNMGISPADDDGLDDLRRLLRAACAKLAHACPSVLEDEYPRFLATDHELFANLLSVELQKMV